MIKTKYLITFLKSVRNEFFRGNIVKMDQFFQKNFCSALPRLAQPFGHSFYHFFIKTATTGRCDSDKFRPVGSLGMQFCKICEKISLGASRLAKTSLSRRNNKKQPKCNLKMQKFDIKFWMKNLKIEFPQKFLLATKILYWRLNFWS